MATETMKRAIQEYIDNRTPVPVSFEPYAWVDTNKRKEIAVPMNGDATEIQDDQLSMAAWIWWEHEDRQNTDSKKIDYLYVLLEDHSVENQEDHFWNGCEFKQIHECASGPNVTGYMVTRSDEWRKLYKMRVDELWKVNFAVMHGDCWQTLDGPWEKGHWSDRDDYEWQTFKRPYQEPGYPTAEED
tara:strand:- start:1757 stop:2314 length:558 start_codon:yes stop_codon:yes gene_type:complete